MRRRYPTEAERSETPRLGSRAHRGRGSCPWLTGETTGKAATHRVNGWRQRPAAAAAQMARQRRKSSISRGGIGRPMRYPCI